MLFHDSCAGTNLVSRGGGLGDERAGGVNLWPCKTQYTVESQILDRIKKPDNSNQKSFPLDLFQSFTPDILNSRFLKPQNCFFRFSCLKVKMIETE